MIVQLLITFVLNFLKILFGWLPLVTTIPPIFGVDIDSALVTGMGSFYRFTATFWMFGDLMLGFLAILGYLLTKQVIKLFLGSRTPGADA